MAGWSPSKNPNPIEAEKLAEIIDHEIRERPEWSIGVAVMNLKQAIRVEELFQEKIDDTIRVILTDGEIHLNISSLKILKMFKGMKETLS